jgi:transcriptional regulator with XRE-family HTH domain
VDTVTLKKDFGNLLRRRRALVGLGQEALADKASIHRTHLSLLERGLRMPTLAVIKKLAEALGTTMSSLMRDLEQGNVEPPPAPKKAPARKVKPKA